MNKNELMKNMSQAYLLLSEKRKEEFSRILNRLLAVNFICGEEKEIAKIIILSVKMNNYLKIF